MFEQHAYFVRTIARVGGGVCADGVGVHNSSIGPIHTGSASASHSGLVCLCAVIIAIQKHHRGLDIDRAICDASLGNGNCDWSRNLLDVGFESADKLHMKHAL